MIPGVQAFTSEATWDGMGPDFLREAKFIPSFFYLFISNANISGVPTTLSRGNS